MSVLDEIIAGVKTDLAARKNAVSQSDLVAQIAEIQPALEVYSRFQTADLGLISEVKRRSPSKGDLASIADPAGLAQQYEAGGATAISVLTEERRFNGSLQDLVEVRSAVKVPILRKDFMVDEYQFYEARAYGADLVLLIVAGLSQPDLVRFHELATSLGMSVLVEVHDAEEISRALDAGAFMIGVNNRDLRTLEVHPEQFAHLAPMIPADRIKIAESGIGSAKDAEYYLNAGADGLLVGEALVKDGNPKSAVAGFLAAGRGKRRLNGQS